uniref:Uncharacterized protein n=1 Tax=Tetraselmis sp. GSL018 TaxID=582737 RepID=A0A061R9J4_9CHLO|eukprot:CAMPEP_0177596854 /NCGR_PEP_ID=MMETSP0419_2-20121207/11368_1 /TAXON_ID=582737 /ORGANISM="Tetraselmis sp., Strain GSL018" /LENGTH=139 /DNA_ID=CAMNT_0019088921 /DNA_START=47 /DNA_END=466 /DNA_ORIENTATION=+
MTFAISVNARAVPLLTSKQPAPRVSTLPTPPVQRRQSLPVLRATEADPKPTSEDSTSKRSTADDVSAAPKNVCPTCGVPLSEAPSGCDGKGRQIGGVGAFIDWWPIKAYRPCPALTSSGGKYKRKGQITDEMLFGKGKR